MHSGKLFHLRDGYGVRQSDFVFARKERRLTQNNKNVHIAELARCFGERRPISGYLNNVSGAMHVVSGFLE